MLPGGNQPERVLNAEEESLYLEAAVSIGHGVLRAYDHARKGIRATVRGEQPIKPTDRSYFEMWWSSFSTPG